jgi:predicted PurR-regulated permease PerM
MINENRDLFHIKIFLGFIASVIFVIILKELKTVFIPLSMSLLLYFLFNGVVKKLLTLKFPKVLILAFLLMFIFIIFYFLGVLIFTGVSSFINKFPMYSDRITELLKSLSTQLKIPISDVNDYINNFDWTKSVNTITSFVSTAFGSFATFIGNLILVIIFLIFMLSGRTILTGRVYRAFNGNKADKMIFIVNSIENQVQHYLLMKTFISLLTGIIGGLIVWVGGIDFVIFSGLLIFILNFIPNFGSVVATSFPIIIGLIKYGFSIRILIIAGALTLTQMIMGNLFEPKIMGERLNLSPIVILVSLIFWGWIWGIIGMILAVPITSALKIIFTNIGPLKPISDLISAE